MGCTAVRVRAYIDGLNLFYGSLKGKPQLKWLDVVRLVDALLPLASVLATYLLIDGMDGLYDEALVISNGSDLVEPIAVANHRFGPVHVVRPNNQYNGQVAGAASSYRSIPGGLLAVCQLPPEVRLANGKTVTRPLEWT
jgi:hypothetical protein